MCRRLEKLLEALKLIGSIAKTILSGIEEYRKIQEVRAYQENKKNKVKYLPGPKKKKYYKRRKQR
jgi:hypothetical protein